MTIPNFFHIKPSVNCNTVKDCWSSNDGFGSIQVRLVVVSDILAIHIATRSLLRSSSTQEPSGPPKRVVFFVLCRMSRVWQWLTASPERSTVVKFPAGVCRAATVGSSARSQHSSWCSVRLETQRMLCPLKSNQDLWHWVTCKEKKSWTSSRDNKFYAERLMRKTV